MRVQRREGGKVKLYSSVLLVWLAACGGAAPDPAQPASDPADVPLEAPLPNVLSAEAEATRDAILEVAARRSERRLARFAATFPEFQSNFGGADHFDHWYMRRRMGVSPTEKLIDLFDQPYAARLVGEEIWFIWPDVATFRPEDFQMNRLSFSDLARLEDLIGEAGVAAMRDGAPYPGFRTAITSDGRWVYFVDGN